MQRPRREGPPNMSPLTLRKRYLPRRDRRPQAAHLPAVSQAATAQEQPLQAPQKPKENPSTPSNANRHALTRFKKGFEWDTELELASAFNRPPRLFKEDSPFYPWLPKPTPIVNFHLNYKF
nr:MAG: hypothetical protein [Gammatorquevirus sp.]